MTWICFGQKDKYNMYNNDTVFDREKMESQIHRWNKALKYDDMTHISTYRYPKPTIDTILPTSLVSFKISSTNLAELPTFGPQIREVEIVDSKIVLTEEQRATLKQQYPLCKFLIYNTDSLKSFFGPKPEPPKPEPEPEPVQTPNMVLSSTITRRHSQSMNVPEPTYYPRSPESDIEDETTQLLKKKTK